VSQFRERVRTEYAQLYLADDQSWGGADWDTLYFGRHPIGLLGTAPGEAILATGLRSGFISFAVSVADDDPGPDLDGYEDIVETAFEARHAEVSLIEGGGERSHRLPALPAGAGWYRMRYHCRGMDEGNHASVNFDVGRIIDEYLLQIWPAQATSPATVKVTSRCAYYLIYDS